MQSPLLQGPARNDQVHAFITRAQPSIWWALILILLLFGSLAVDVGLRILDAFNPVIACCSLSRPQNAENTLQWTNALNAGDCTLSVCFSSGFVKQQGKDGLKWDLSIANQYSLFALFGVFVICLGLMEYVYIVVMRDSRACQALLPYGLYVGMNKAKYYLCGLVLGSLIVTACALQVIFISQAATDVSTKVGQTDLYLSFADTVQGAHHLPFHVRLLEFGGWPSVKLGFWSLWLSARQNFVIVKLLCCQASQHG